MKQNQSTTATTPDDGSAPAESAHDNGCSCGCAEHAGASEPGSESMPVADLAELIGATQSAVSHQLRTLKQARLVKFQRDGKNVIYSLSDDHVYTMLAQGMTHICE